MRLVEVFSGTLFEAEMVKSLLENEGIIAFLKDQYTGTRSAVWSPNLGVKLTVPEEDFPKARLVVTDYEKRINEK